MRIKLFLLVLGICSLPLFAAAQTDTTFWFAAPDLQQAHGDRPVLLRLTAGATAATVTISLPANAAFTPLVVTVPANSAQSVDLTSYIDLIENSVVNTVSDRGIKVTSTAMISCYYDIANGLNGDIYALKGANALGFKFTLPFQMVFDGSGLPNYTCSFSIVATEDNTTVTITPKSALLSYPAGVPFTITLNRGQTYTCQAATNTPAARPGGTIVVANKRIAISTKDDSIRYPGAGCSDTAGDQLIPDCNAGTSFIIPRGYLNGPDYYYVFAINNNTSVSVNGIAVATLAAGSFYTGTLSDPSCSIQTSSPVHVFHVSGFGCEVGGAVIPSIENEGSSFIGVTRASSNPFGLNILCRPAHIGGFSVNGLTTVLQATDFSAVPGTNGNWMVARIQINNTLAGAGQSVRVQNATGRFHMGMIHGDVSSTTRYGYFSDFEKINIDLAQYDTLYCKGSTVALAASSPGASDFQWTGPNGFTATGPNLQLTNFQESNQGFYTVSAVSARCGYIERKIWVGIQLPVADFTAPSQCINAGPVSFSSNSTINAGSITSFNWKFGTGAVGSGQQVNYQYTAAGTYSVTLVVSSTKLCRDSIQKVVTILPSPSGGVLTPTTTNICETGMILLTATGGATYQWFLNAAPLAGITAATLTATQPGLYTVELISAQGCRAPGTGSATLTGVVGPGSNIRYRTINAVRDQPQTLQARSIGASYSWSPAIGLSAANIANPVFRATQGQEYLITIRTPGNCVLVDTQTVRIFANGNIYVPTAFTPNADGLNDKLEFFSIGIKQFNFLRIFNRWGQLVFETRSDQVFWDGRFNGILQATGVYVWYAEGITNDDVKIFQKGLVTLVRK